MPILMYHRVADDGPASLARWRISPPDFARQIEWLAAEGFESIRLDEWLDAERRDRASLQRRVVLTFDDAYADFVTTAFPISSATASDRRCSCRPDTWAALPTGTGNSAPPRR
jgi:peptidoglycan/xylan/chitin deacetylase (PgdA/CDA1 family)